MRINPKVKIPGMVRLLSPYSGLWQNSDPFTSGESKEIQIQGPQGSIRIYYDDRMVPHIFADNDHDALFAQGYVEANARLWQMDFMSRVASGKLSEVLGINTLKSDIMMRKYALEYGANAMVEKWKEFPDIVEKTSSYLDGINAYIQKVKNNKDLPVEFKLANYQPKDWTQIQSALISKYMAFTLCKNHSDVAMSNNKAILGEELFYELYRDRDPKQVPVIPENNSKPFKQNQRKKPIDVEYKNGLLKNIQLRAIDEGIGSNNWAISSSKSKTGYPILANDPHLQLSLPSIWYELHIVTPNINAHGVSVPGIPGIIIGFNEDIAWGSTNVGQDVLDLYSIDWTNPEKTEYLLDGVKTKAQIIPQIIKVKNGNDITYDQKITAFGPILYESPDSLTPDLAAQWIALLTPQHSELDIFFEAMKCDNYDCFKKQTDHFFAPAQNLVFADRDGDIGIRVTGNLPIKYEEEGKFVKNGNSISNKWSEYIPRESNPETLNPSRGYVSSANQISVGEDFPHYFNGRFGSYRGRRINDLLNNALTKMDHEDMFAFQQDAYSIKAEELLPVLLSYISDKELSDKASQVRDSLLSWDYNYIADLSAPSIFEAWVKELNQIAWDELYEDKDAPVEKPKNWILNSLAENHPNHKIFDIKSTKKKESLEDLSLQSFLSMVSKLDFNKEYEWRKYNPVNINNLLNIPGYSDTNIKINGCSDALNATRGNFGPSWRMVVELGPTPKAWGVYPGGQSGNPLSKYYDNMIDKWARGEYYEISLNSNEAYYEKDHLHKETLKPGDE